MGSSDSDKQLSRQVGAVDLCIYKTQLADMRVDYQAGKRELAEVVIALISRSDGSPDGLIRATLALHGIGPYGKQLASELGADEAMVLQLLEREMSQNVDVFLTGSETVALVLMEEQVTHVVGYPGTSELALCDDVARLNRTILINGRGDTECVFIAAGLSLTAPAQAIALLHGARGSTNAMGAIATARRNECALVCIIGMPTTSSQPFLPPHAEPALIEGLTTFAKDGWRLPSRPSGESYAEIRAAGVEVIASLRRAFQLARMPPYGPILVGVPQNTAEEAWIPLDAWVTRPAKEMVTAKYVDSYSMTTALRLIREAKRPLLLVDDPVYRHAGAREALTSLLSLPNWRMLQVAYRRGPMLFEQLSGIPKSSYLGLWSPDDPNQRAELEAADLLITVEDRNMYPRVVGSLPATKKIAINSDPGKVAKNRYLGDSDVLIQGDPAAILRILVQELGTNKAGEDRVVQSSSQATDHAPFGFLRYAVPLELARVLSLQNRPIIIDDSQMFGGVFSERYSELPPRTRVFGDHSGFVGSGLGLAVGAALRAPEDGVWCLVGDQAFTNGFQSLICAGEQRANVKVVVCDNGCSVSLLKQGFARSRYAFDRGLSGFLDNPKSLDYLALAQAVGLDVFDIVYNPNSSCAEERDPTQKYREALAEAADRRAPTLIRLRVPADPRAWAGIWAIKGQDNL